MSERGIPTATSLYRDLSGAITTRPPRLNGSEALITTYSFSPFHSVVSVHFGTFSNAQAQNHQ
jgi:hypothetical protein